MSLEKNLLSRSGGKCEISGETENLKIFAVLPSRTNDLQDHLLLNQNLIDQIENPETMDENSWRGLSDSMWSEHLPVQIISWRMLSRLQKHEMLDQMYLEEDDLNWAKATGEGEDDENKIIHKDCNGVTLQTGDSVVLIKDLKVKGSSMVAKQGTAVRNIRLDHENAEYIEGKVDGQQIVIITQYVKKV